MAVMFCCCASQILLEKLAVSLQQVDACHRFKLSTMVDSVVMSDIPL